MSEIQATALIGTVCVLLAYWLGLYVGRVRHLAMVERPVNAKLLRALKELIRDADCSDYGEEGINYPVPSTHLRGASCPICEARDAIADAESQAGPVRLTEAEIGVIDRQSREGIKSLMSTWPVPLARAIEDAVLERNGLKPQAKGD